MKNKTLIITMAVVFVLLLTITSVFAIVRNPLQIVDYIKNDDNLGDGWGQLYKVYDENNGATCYIFHYIARGGGISCVK